MEDTPDNEIRHYMTAHPVTVTPTTPIGELAQTMVGAPIVTSTDILAAVADAAQRALREGQS